MLVPLHGFLRGDSLGLLVLAQDQQTLIEVAAQLAQAATVRVEPKTNLVVVFRGRRLDSHLTVAAAGLRPLDRIDVLPENER